MNERARNNIERDKKRILKEAKKNEETIDLRKTTIEKFRKD